MASPRLTVRIKNSIISKGSSLFLEQLRKKEKQLPIDFWDMIMQELYDANYAHHLGLGLPDMYFKSVKQIDVTGAPGGSIWNKPLNKTYKMLYADDLFSGSSFRIRFEQLALEQQQTYTKFQEGIKAVEQERITFLDELRSVLQNCNTVQQFLKVWPQGEHLIPELANEPAKTRKKIKIEIEEKTIAKLNSSLLKQTMLKT